ncbi:hypothetical protein SCYAM73S_06118 [Streptomyces cyaneofuscatus]
MGAGAVGPVRRGPEGRPGGRRRRAPGLRAGGLRGRGRPGAACAGRVRRWLRARLPRGDGGGRPGPRGRAGRTAGWGCCACYECCAGKGLILTVPATVMTTVTAASMPTVAVPALLPGFGGGASTGWCPPYPVPNGAVRAAGARHRWRTRSWTRSWPGRWWLVVRCLHRWWCVRWWWCVGARGPRAGGPRVRRAGRWRRASGLPPPGPSSAPEPLPPSSEPRRGYGCWARCAGASHPLTSGAPRSAGRRAACRRFARSRAVRRRSLVHRAPTHPTRPSHARAGAAVRRGARWLPRPGGPGCRPLLSSGRPRTLRPHRCSPSGPGPRAGCANAGRWASVRRYRRRVWRGPVRPPASGRCSGYGPGPGEWPGKRRLRARASLCPTLYSSPCPTAYAGGHARRPPRAVRARRRNAPASRTACSVRSLRPALEWPAEAWTAVPVHPKGSAAYDDGLRGAARHAGPGRSTGGRRGACRSRLAYGHGGRVRRRAARGWGRWGVVAYARCWSVPAPAGVSLPVRTVRRSPVPPTSDAGVPAWSPPLALPGQSARPALALPGRRGWLLRAVPAGACQEEGVRPRAREPVLGRDSPAARGRPTAAAAAEPRCSAARCRERRERRGWKELPG